VIGDITDHHPHQTSSWKLEALALTSGIMVFHRATRPCVI
jgi:hypothetical protein